MNISNIERDVIYRSLYSRKMAANNRVFEKHYSVCCIDVYLNGLSENMPEEVTVDCRSLSWQFFLPMLRYN